MFLAKHHENILRYGAKKRGARNEKGRLRDLFRQLNALRLEQDAAADCALNFTHFFQCSLGVDSVHFNHHIANFFVGLQMLTNDVDVVSAVDKICKSMAKLCIGFSGADLAALCRAGAVRCLSCGDEASGITEKHFMDAYYMQTVRSSNDALVKRISQWQP